MKPKTKIVYKVVALPKNSTNKETYYSSSLNEIPKDYRISYRLNRWTKPKKGKIFAFKTLDAAQNFVETIMDSTAYRLWGDRKYFIFKSIAKYDGVSRKFRIPYNHAYTFQVPYKKHNMDKFWDGKLNSKNSVVSKFNDNTIMCNELKLLERIA
jgi:hypothetical protein